MTIDFTLGNLSRNTRIGSASSIQSAQSVPQAASTSLAERTDLFAVRDQLVLLFQRVEALAELANVKLRSTAQTVGAPVALSSAGLGLNLTTTATTLQSTAEINTNSLGFDSTPPAWQGSSSTTFSMFGNYDGSQGTDTLTFTAQNAGLRGVTDLLIRVSDGANATLANVTVDAADPVSTRYAIGNGLEFSIGSGNQFLNDIATLDVFDNVDTTIYPDQPFNGAGTSGANFDPDNAAVVNGNFDINGASISVADDDTLDAVLDRINSSAAGVTAVFNAASERIEFTQNTDGNAPDISLSGDTSNLLDTLALSGASAVPGRDSDASVLLNSLTRFEATSAGNISINGTDIAVDPSTASLTDLVSSLDAGNADVDVTFDDVTQRVRFEATDPLATLNLADDVTGILAALNIDAGEFGAAKEQSTGVSRRRSYEIADAVEALAETVNAIFSNGTFVSGGQFAGEARSALNGALSFTLSTENRRFGLGLDLQGSDRFLLDRRGLTRGLQQDGRAALNFLSGSDTRPGFIETLANAARSALTQVSNRLGVSDGLVDTTA